MENSASIPKVSLSFVGKNSNPSSASPHPSAAVTPNALGTNTEVVAEGGPSRRGRGRPPGSKNKPKPPPASATTMQPQEDAVNQTYVISIPSGSDVIETLINFSRGINSCITVLNGFGMVSNVTVCLPSPNTHPLVFNRPIGIVSLNGNILFGHATRVDHTGRSYQVSLPPCVSFSVSLAGPRGELVGGVVAGRFKAASTVTVMATTFLNPSIHKLNEDGNYIENETAATDHHSTGGHARASSSASASLAPSGDN